MLRLVQCLAAESKAQPARACRWAYSVADDFFTKQLPHNVTWALSLMYALSRNDDFASTAVQASGSLVLAVI